MSSINEKYFSILKDYFSDLAEWNKKKGFQGFNSQSEIYKIYSPELMRSILNSLTDDLSNLNWDAQQKNVKNLGGLKTSYLGSAFSWQKDSNETSEFLKKTSLYSDTCIIRDPVLSELLAYQLRGSGEILSFLFVVNHALKMLEIESLFSTDINPPICALAPSEVFILQKKGIWESTDEFILDKLVPIYVSELFGQHFESSDDFIDHLEKFKNFNEFDSFLNNSNKILRGLNGEEIDVPTASQILDVGESAISYLDTVTSELNEH